METKHIISIVVGVILVALGLFLLLARGELVLEIVGKERIMREAFFGGNSVRNTIQVIFFSGVVSLIAGLLLTVFGIIFGIRKKQVIS